MSDYCHKAPARNGSMLSKTVEKCQGRRPARSQGLSVLRVKDRRAAKEAKPVLAHVAQPKYGDNCRHCVTGSVNRPRGLCWGCYYTPGVRALYASNSKYARRGVGNFSGEAPLAPEPTTAAPGTPEKLAVFEVRAKLLQAIFHPADARYEGDSLPIEWIREHSGLGTEDRRAA